MVPREPAEPGPGDPLVVWERGAKNRESTFYSPNEDNERTIYARNDTHAPITVTYLWLYQCKNVNRECGELRPQIVVQPGQTAKLLTVGFVPGDACLASALQSACIMSYKFELRYQ